VDADIENQDEGDSPRVVEHGFGALLLATKFDFCFNLLTSKAKE
jgi:hypothetical protein